MAKSSWASPADVVLLGAELSAIAHVGGVVHVGQTVQQHPVFHFDITELGAGPSVKVMGDTAHAFHASRDSDLNVTARDGLSSQCDGLHATGTHLVDGGARHVVRDACCHGCLTRGRLAQSRLQHVAHEHLFHPVSGHSPFSSAPRIAAAPKSVAGTVDNAPKKLPIGVRTAETT